MRKIFSRKAFGFGAPLAALLVIILTVFMGSLTQASVGPQVTSCDYAGNPKDQFLPGEDVYVKGTGFTGNPFGSGIKYYIYIQPNPVNNGQELVAANDPSGAQEEVFVTIGWFSPVLVWQACSGPTGNWDIVVDNADYGEGIFQNDYFDGLDDATVVGFVAPVPELPGIALLSIGLFGLVGWVGMKKWRRGNSLKC